MMVNQNKLIDLFLSLVQIDAVSLNERPVADFIIQKLSQLGIDVKEDEAGGKINGNCGNLIVRLSNGKDDDNSILCMAHLDTVKSTENLKPVVNNGIIQSDGNTILGADDRAGVAVILYILEEITSNKRSHRNVEVVFSVAEEIGMRGTMSLDFSTLRSKEGYILDCSRKPGCFVAQTPTAVDLKVEFHGRGAHSAVNPEAGINAISMAMEALSQFPVGRVDEHTVANIGMIHGGQAINIVPDHVVCEGECRSFDKAKIDAVKKDFEFTCKSVAEKYGGTINPSFKTGFVGFNLERDLPVIRRLESGLRSIGLEPDPLVYYGGSDANVLNRNGITAVNIGIGVNNPHSHQESIGIKDLIKTAQLMMQVLEVQ